jgi:histidine ammonia-lyase
MIELDGRTLDPARLARIADGEPARLSVDARARMDASALWYEARGGAGILRQKWAWVGGGEAPTDTAELVRRFVIGHCAGVGAPLPREAVRATMAARINVLATGLTGCRAVCADALLAMLAADVVPQVPSQGSVGAAGDLAPLAHILRVACGLGGHAWRAGVLLPAAEAMAGLSPMQPNEKDALALINGATLTAALAALACFRSRRLLEAAEAACALSFEVVRADTGCLSIPAMQARHHPGPVGVARRVAAALEGSELSGAGRQADPFSIRCAPAVIGAAWDALAYVEGVVTRELNGACDNPLVFEASREVVEAGNFHGAPVALAMDHLKVALTQVASIAERRVFRLTYGQLSGLPSFLVPGTGLNSGLMLAQYTAASLVSECKGLSHPASVDSIPTVQHHEDHVSMGPIAARGALAIADMLADVLAIELLCAAQGLDFHLAGEAIDAEGRQVRVPPLRCGAGTRVTFERVRRLVTRWTDDRVMHPDLVILGGAVRDGRFSLA